ncbi:5-dehydro-4-deoxy-D-glucuronate isomerase [Flaviaesturariibacter flavus]|uniref:4-deoxy-L-threo-5-hexosulose-uronate ketol-isomerase n=1 Tax=Flaviaesturariibacter flavus TaxID=2502780 RepID=A0A4R1BK88_9BACT|nr:5-dehydro-4-deoxy-D-glucuronate isomerase [Flaviaesturariibacter flavus]TCJ17687.1 5-dehydro-4-deoxy-D-glucuronate isomerase [Flaviaesturariibacter flavus]
MEIRFENGRAETAAMDTDTLRRNFLVEGLMTPGQLKLVYTHYDRMVVGGAMPAGDALTLGTHTELKANFFLERRELGIINVGGAGTVTAGSESYELGKLECLYVGRGTETVTFRSTDPTQPAVFYLLSAPAHTTHPTRKFTRDEAAPVTVGDAATSNHRTIYKYIHADGIQSCQLVMGLTILEPGSVWNTMPAHLHSRRMEAYFYFNLPEDQRVFHFMGEPQQTRHLVVANHDAIISPPWSIHSGCGTSNYGFIWGMAGENRDYTDVDPVPLVSMR